MNSRRKKIFIDSLSRRRITLLSMGILLALCIYLLGPLPYPFPTHGDGFFSAAFSPTLTDQNTSLPEGATPFWLRLVREMGNTIRFALIAMSIALPAGLILGFFSSTTWWPSRDTNLFFSILLRPFYYLVRFFITLIRSIHELIWALIFLAAIGDEPITACIALALPFTGTLAKVFSEIIDEQPLKARNQMVNSGTGYLRAYLTTLLPASLPDVATYSLYRFECALRSSAVLGFIGIETIGLSIRRSFENHFYHELWTELYFLILVIMSVDLLGAALRKRLNSAPLRKKIPKKNGDAKSHLKRLKVSSPKWKLSRILPASVVILVVVACLPQLFGIQAQPLTKDSTSIDRSQRVENFLTQITPKTVRDSGEWKSSIPWASQLWRENGKLALINTLAMASAAMILAAFAVWLLVPWANRQLANAKPFGIFSGRKNKLLAALWESIGFSTRVFFTVSRAIPEYIYAYLLIGILGISAWPLVLALALHNLGILGRLWGEVIENQPIQNPRQLILSGSGRFLTYLASYMPVCFNHFLMYLFYRWETCVRETTVLGMLGFASLGLQIHLARNFSRAYDEMIFYVLLGTCVIFLGDIASHFLRKNLR